jgi:hypothetical protein
MGSALTMMKGTVRGKIIELETEPGLPDGQQVTVMVEPMPRPGILAESPSEALKRAAGSWSDDPDGLDRFLEWNRQQRKIDRRPLAE